MKSKKWFYPFALIGWIFLLAISCQKDDRKIIKEKVTGCVQKGPFINGTTILMSELNSSLNQTGNIFTTQILDNNGSFELANITLTSSYVEFSANGFYFDEVKGDKSIAQLNLYALSDLTDISTVNVNILTHLEKQRVTYLVKQNKSLTEAKKTAQTEILGIFGFGLNDMEASEKLDISVNNESNAILLAISVMMQGNRSVGDLTELMANITSDIRVDGILNNDSIKTSLRNSAKDLSLSAIRTNLENRYQELGVSASIPDFEKYVNDYLVFTGQKPTGIVMAATNIDTTVARINGEVNANSLSTTVSFEYGTSTGYGNTISATPGAVTGNSLVNVGADLTGLAPGTTYNFRVKTENSLGITYSENLSFYTHPINPEPVQDIEGNTYTTVRIGKQIWMAENLKTTKYNNGDIIETTQLDISTESTPKYQWSYQHDEANAAVYGRLYTWYAATDSRSVCPTGWHVPLDSDWTTLIDFLGGPNVAGSKLKESGNAHWSNSDPSTNESGFTGLPGGIYNSFENNWFGLGEFGAWQCAKESIINKGYGLGVGSSSNCWRNYSHNSSGVAVRCLMD